VADVLSEEPSSTTITSARSGVLAAQSLTTWQWWAPRCVRESPPKPCARSTIHCQSPPSSAQRRAWTANIVAHVFMSSLSAGTETRPLFPSRAGMQHPGRSAGVALGDLRDSRCEPPGRCSRYELQPERAPRRGVKVRHHGPS
jgi:hypothetical protein